MPARKRSASGDDDDGVMDADQHEEEGEEEEDGGFGSLLADESVGVGNGGEDGEVEEEEEEEEEEGKEEEEEEEEERDDEEEDRVEEEGEKEEEEEREMMEEKENNAAAEDDMDEDDDHKTADSQGSLSSCSGGKGEDNQEEADEYIIVKLSDIRKEFQCPICLGIIRKTRTVMECLHRFCRECIDKSMRLGNNECPACRTHCASRRSLRDDPNYDALIAAIYPDIDKYEEEELAFHEEEKSRNKQIQASIAQTLRRQSEALVKRRSAKATAAAFTRRVHGNYRNSGGQGRRSRNRDTGHAASDEDEEDAHGNEDVAGDQSDDVDISRGSPGPSNLSSNPEVLVWTKVGTRSHTRHGSAGGSNGKIAKNSRLMKLQEYLARKNTEEKESEFEIHFTVLSSDEKNIPNMERPYLCCRPTLSMQQLCHYISLELPVQAEDIEIVTRKHNNLDFSEWRAHVDSSNSGVRLPRLDIGSIKEAELDILDLKQSLQDVYYNYSFRCDLILMYRKKSNTEIEE